jgi:hypothetical protein
LGVLEEEVVEIEAMFSAGGAVEDEGVKMSNNA